MTKPIALAADHGGFELKEAVKAHLEELGLEYIDYGTHSTASVDYPDMALPACDAVVSAAFADPASFDRSQLIFATVMYSFQLYADFSGYTDIVLGMGEILGLHLPENFRQPFFSASVKELWARWHISLSQWFRDYVYIPLGGNRKGIAYSTTARPRCSLLQYAQCSFRHAI